MAARHATSSGRILKITVDPAAATPLSTQIYSAVRLAIVEGRVGAGRAIPSSRRLAADLTVSRSTVVLALEQLRAEGYIETRQGASSRVSLTLPDAPPRFARRAPVRTSTVAVRSSARVQAAALHSQPIARTFSARGARAFRIGVPSFDLFPMELWGRTLAAAWRAASPRSLGYGDVRGHAGLRARIAEYVSAARGVRCQPDDVIVTAGSQQAIGIASLALTDPGDDVWIEDPGYFGASASLTIHGARLVPVPVDREGLDVAAGIARSPDARAAFVMPNRHPFLGVNMSADRRRELLEWACRAKSHIIEDDYGAEFQFGGRPLPALQAEDDNDRVVHIGSFSKIMFPSLRLGFIVVPSGLAESFGVARQAVDLHSPYIEQATMAAFLEAGHYERHVRRMRQVYLERQQLVTELAARYLRGWLHVPPVDGGMTLTGWLPAGVSDTRVAEEALADGIEVNPLSLYAIEHRHPPALLLGFAAVSTSEIREGIEQLARTFERIERTGVDISEAPAAPSAALSAMPPSAVRRPVRGGQRA